MDPLYFRGRHLAAVTASVVPPSVEEGKPPYARCFYCLPFCLTRPVEGDTSWHICPSGTPCQPILTATSSNLPSQKVNRSSDLIPHHEVFQIKRRPLSDESMQVERDTSGYDGYNALTYSKVRRYQKMTSSSKAYLDIPDRRDSPAVHIVLEGIISGMPLLRGLSIPADCLLVLQSGTLNVNDRSSLLRAIVEDLCPGDDSIWKSWDKQGTCHF